MSDLLQLLKAVILNPEEDLPRLMYADALEELELVYKACPRCEEVKGYKCNFCDGTGDSGDYHASRMCVYCDGRGYGKVDCRACSNTGRVLDATNRERAKFIRNAIARRSDNLECYKWPRSYDVGFDPVAINGPWHIEFDRGFACNWTTTAADFLTHADAIVWHPEQTVPCGKCDGRGYWNREPDPNDFHDVGGPMDCESCRMSGRVPRECPPTAQPITSVTLTAYPSAPVLEESMSRAGGQVRLHGRQQWYDFMDIPPDVDPWLWLLQQEWPGVKFTLPHGQPA